MPRKKRCERSFFVARFEPWQTKRSGVGGGRLSATRRGQKRSGFGSPRPSARRSRRRQKRRGRAFRSSVGACCFGAPGDPVDEVLARSRRTGEGAVSRDGTRRTGRDSPQDRRRIDGRASLPTRFGPEEGDRRLAVRKHDRAHPRRETGRRAGRCERPSTRDHVEGRGKPASRREDRTRPGQARERPVHECDTRWQVGRRGRHSRHARRRSHRRLGGGSISTRRDRVAGCSTAAPPRAAPPRSASRSDRWS